MNAFPFPVIYAANPFIDAYVNSDVLGKLIFIALVLLSVVTWIIVLHKGWITYQAKTTSSQFKKKVTAGVNNILNVDAEAPASSYPNPFLTLYLVLKEKTIEILEKNKHFGATGQEAPFLSPSDINIVESHLSTAVAQETKHLEKYLYLLATVVSLGPFLGLLGTVWGILTTFSHLQAETSASTNQMVLGGLSLALATTVLGLIDAIPALIGYNYLKNSIRDFSVEMECFSSDILAQVEMQYRKVDID